jgi:hypothetical protein
VNTDNSPIKIDTSETEEIYERTDNTSWRGRGMYKCIFMYIHMYMAMHIYIDICMHIYIYIHIFLIYKRILYMYLCILYI